jgi:hypothetical protein
MTVCSIYGRGNFRPLIWLEVKKANNECHFFIVRLYHSFGICMNGKEEKKEEYYKGKEIKGKLNKKKEYYEGEEVKGEK